LAANVASNRELPDIVNRPAAVAGSVVFLMVAPGTVAGLVPWWISHWQFHLRAWWWLPAQAFGFVLLAAGAAVLIDSFARFSLQGFGTPAPVLPTTRLIVGGLYRYVRNPMYVSVLALILGQGIIFANVSLLEYFIAVWIAFHLFVTLYEEPTLRRAYGGDYDRFCRNVPRWIPRWPKATSPMG
jgi:protein-S-isoprenylcysteine O-methyltransferase Ste14